MSAAGWYPDPGGVPGQFRYWTGTAWTPAVTSNPSAPAPGGPSTPASGGHSAYGYGSGGYASPGGYQSVSSYQPGGGYQSGGGSQPLTGYSQYQPYETPEKKKSSVGWIVGLVAVAVAIVLIVVFAIPRLLTPGLTPGPAEPGPGNPTTPMCPRVNAAQQTTNRVENGRIYGGAMSYPQLGDPWEPPHIEDRIPYGPSAYSQTVVDQTNTGPDPVADGWEQWVSAVVIADLWNGDGFASTQQGAELILGCVMGTYYSDTEVGQTNTTGGPHPVDGHDGWLIDTTLTFSIPNLHATSERVLLLVVDTGVSTDGNHTYSMFYTSVPNTSSERQPDVEQALASLAVDG